MNRMFLGATALMLTIPAMAQVQAPPPQGAPPLAPMARGMDATQTRDQAVAKVREHFARMDVNRDGFVAGDEMQSMRGHHQGMDHQMGKRRDRGARPRSIGSTPIATI